MTHFIEYASFNKNSNLYVLYNQVVKNNIAKNENYNIAINTLLDLLCINDQFPRANGIYSDTILIKRSEKINQEIFSYLIDFGIVDSSIFNDQRFQTVLLHSIFNNVGFFEKYFYKTAKFYNCDFDTFFNLKFMFDNYMKIKKNTQYFMTTRGFLSNDKFGMLPQENIDTVKYIFEILRFSDEEIKLILKK